MKASETFVVGKDYKFPHDHNYLFKCVWIGEMLVVVRRNDGLEFSFDPRNTSAFRDLVEHVPKKERTVYNFLLQSRSTGDVTVGYATEGKVEQYRQNVERHFDVLAIKKVTIREGEGL